MGNIPAGTLAEKISSGSCEFPIRRYPLSTPIGSLQGFDRKNIENDRRIAEKSIPGSLSGKKIAKRD
jgi:hypothetical protein